MGCVPAGCYTYSKPYNRIRHCHPHYHSTLLFMWCLNFITATTKNSALQRYVIERKAAQADVETPNYLEQGVWHLFVEYCYASLKTWKQVAVPLWVYCGPQGPSGWFGSHRPMRSRLCKTRARFFSMTLFQFQSLPRTPLCFHVGLCAHHCLFLFSYLNLLVHQGQFECPPSPGNQRVTTHRTGYVLRMHWSRFSRAGVSVQVAFQISGGWTEV